jgi:glycosyltransferase involved in cell wall biosynthesis
MAIAQCTSPEQPLTSCGAKPIVLAIVTLDSMAWVLLRPWLQALTRAGYTVHLACRDTGYVGQLEGAGYIVHRMNLSRSFNPFAHIRPLIEVVRLLRRQDACVINTHSPIAAAVGRVAGLLTGRRNVVYTVHGFYFHDGMPAMRRCFFQGLEWILGAVTESFMFVSDEDHRTAKSLGIVRPRAKSLTIWNGIELHSFRPRSESVAESTQVRAKLNVPEGAPICCMVGRIVKEKGYREFLEMAATVRRVYEDCHFLVVGATLASDRDQFGSRFASLVDQRGMLDRFRFTGQVNDVAPFLRASDIFVLPSYREGFPRSVIEAMGCGLPVVTTDIRGCREAVVNNVTGFICPARDSSQLTERVLRLLDDPELRREMGARGRARAVELYDERLVQARFVGLIGETVRAHCTSNRCDVLATTRADGS